MKNGLIFILGLFAALGLSWAGIVMGSNAQLGALPPYADDADTAPGWFPGVAARGQLVYRDLGCGSCHTQQVRRPDFGSDSARGWGDRQSVARDYIYQAAPQLGSGRVGPDLTNLAGRKPSAPDEEDLMKLLYQGHGAMPGYKFLFDRRKVIGEVSDQALKLTGAAAAPARLRDRPDPARPDAGRLPAQPETRPRTIPRPARSPPSARTASRPPRSPPRPPPPSRPPRPTRRYPANEQPTSLGSASGPGRLVGRQPPVGAREPLGAPAR